LEGLCPAAGFNTAITQEVSNVEKRLQSARQSAPKLRLSAEAQNRLYVIIVMGVVFIGNCHQRMRLSGFSSKHPSGVDKNIHCLRCKYLDF
jgi:hypothetical protein